MSIEKLATIGEMFEVYVKAIFEGVEGKIGPVQYEETRQAFYSGTWALLTTMTVLASPDYTEDEGENYLEKAFEEMKAYFEMRSKEQEQEIRGKEGI